MFFVDVPLLSSFRHFYRCRSVLQTFEAAALSAPSRTSTAAMSDPSSQKTTAPWHAIYPTPKSDPASIPRMELLQWFHEGRKPGKDFMLIDLRRTDHEVSSRRLPNQMRQFFAFKCQSICMQGGTIHGSINLPAQTLYPTIPTLYTLFSAAKIEKVIWYCGKSISKLGLRHQLETLQRCHLTQSWR